VQNLRLEYWEKIKNVKPENLIFIDESGSNLAMEREYARAFEGSRAYGTVPLNRGKNITIIGAIALRGLIAYINLLGAANSIVFEAFIVQLLIPNLWQGAVVVMDNSRIHKEEDLRPLIEAKGASLTFLPPYSPDFSPIENCWSKIKSFLRSSAARTYKDLDQAIKKAFEHITLRDIHNWFTHCCYCDFPFSDNSQITHTTVV
jgi:transposase